MGIQQVEIEEFHPSARLFLVTYLSQGLRVKGYLAVPRGEGPFPLLVYCRGGIKNVGMTKLAWVSSFVEQGFLVFAPFYRGNRGGEGREDFCGEDRWDVLDALSWLCCHPLVDKQQLHLFGFSRGAVMALFAAMEYRSAIRSVTVWGGVSDMVLTYEERVDLRRMLKRVIGGPPWKIPEAYHWRTPLHRMEELQCPVLIIHGSKDPLVGVEHAYRLERSLAKYDKMYSMLIYQGLCHHFPAPIHLQTIEYMFSWMKNPHKPPSVQLKKGI